MKLAKISYNTDLRKFQEQNKQKKLHTYMIKTQKNLLE